MAQCRRGITMALIGNLDTQYGVVATYHIITSYSWRKFNFIDVEVASYASQIAREDGAAALCSQSFRLSNVPPDYEVTVNNLYTLILALPIEQCVFANSEVFTSDDGE